MRYWKYRGEGVTPRPYRQRVSAKRLQMVTEMRRVKLRASMSALEQIINKGFVYTDNLTGFAEAIGFLKNNQIPYEYIDGGKHWKYAIRRTDREGN